MLKTFYKTFFQKFLVHELSWYLFGQLLVQISSFVSAIIVSRYLGPTNLGLFSFSQNFVSVTLSIFAGADFYLIWKIATTKDFRKELQNAFAYKIRLHIVLAIVGIIASLLFLPKDVAILCVILFLPSLLQSFSIFTSYALSRNYAKQTGIIQAVLAIIFLLFKVAGVYLELPLIYFVIVAAFDVTMFGLVMYLYCSSQDIITKNFFKGLPSVDVREMIRFLIAISVTIVSIFFWGLLLRIDQFLLAIFTDAHTLGLYVSAVKVAEMPNIIAGVITSALTSRIALLPSTEKKELQRKVGTLLFSQGAFGFLIMLPLVVFATPIINTIYGEAFSGSDTMLRLYALTIPFMFINYVFHSMYGSFSLLKFQAINYSVAVVINLVFGTIGYMTFGVEGVILATVFAYFCCAIFGFLYFKKNIFV